MTSLSWDHAKDLLLTGMFGAFVSLVGTQLRALVASIEKLNISIAHLLERVDSHEHRISKIEDKL